MIWIRVVLGLSAAALIAATVLMLIKSDKKIISLSALITAGVGIALNLVVVITNWVMNGYVPFISIYQVLAFVGVCFPLSFLFIYYVRKTKTSFAWFTLCEGVCMVGCEFMYSTMIWQRAPALQSPFFLPHIICYMLSYSLCAVAFVQTIILLVHRIKKADGEVIAETEKVIYSLTITGFPFMVMGMFLGAIWANECWGTYWGWDPKETWALITTCLYALYFHIRKHKFFKEALIPVLILAFLCLIMTFVGINLFGLNALHSYS